MGGNSPSGVDGIADGVTRLWVQSQEGPARFRRSRLQRFLPL